MVRHGLSTVIPWQTAVTAIGLREPLRHPFVLMAQARTTQITIAGLIQTCYPATEGQDSPIIIIYGFFPPRSVVDGHRGRRLAPYLEQEPALQHWEPTAPLHSAAPRDARPILEGLISPVASPTDALTELDEAGQYIYTVQGVIQYRWTISNIYGPQQPFRY